MTARSFSMAVILPLTTLPSKASSCESVSLSSAAKSSRVGFISLDSLTAVLIPAPVQRRLPRSVRGSSTGPDGAAARAAHARAASPRAHDV